MTSRTSKRSSGVRSEQRRKQRGKRIGGVTGKGFLSGRSGNPGGRPKEAKVVRDFFLGKLTNPKELEALWQRARKSDVLMGRILEQALGRPFISLPDDGGDIPTKVQITYEFPGKA